MTPVDIVECSTCRRMFHNNDGTRVCPNGHENPWDDDDAAYEERLRGVMW